MRIGLPAAHGILERIMNLFKCFGRSAAPLTCLVTLSLALGLGNGCSSGSNATGANTVAQTDAKAGDSSANADSSEADGITTADTAGVDADAAQPQDTTQQPSDAADAVADTQVGDTTVTDTAVTDGATGDSSGDAKADSGKTDGGGSDVAVVDAGPPKPDKCEADVDCAMGNWGTCLPAICNKTTGACELTPAKDGSACKTLGPCGNQGVCKLGACIAASACVPQQCQAIGLSCGSKIELKPADFGASTLSNYPCLKDKWTGGEIVYALGADATATAAVTLTLGTGAQAVLIDLAVASAGVCDPNACFATGNSMTLGLAPGVVHRLVVETAAANAGPVTLSVDCTAITICGDGQCAVGESAATCPKDCGGLAVCGDGNCEAGTESCGSCPADCGDCPPECTPKTMQSPNPTGCSGCACEQCVCKGPIPGGNSGGDGFCCQSAWDNLCVSECGQCGTKCPSGSLCGDNKCDFSESFTNCPNDCPAKALCGDGLCVAGESCTTCPTDCGGCGGATPLPKCGDKTCDASEHCNTCPQDCGICSGDCTVQTGKGCPGCACESQVCDVFPECCTTAWDSNCVSMCASVGKLTCPVSTCGDGECAPDEDAYSCPDDCADCGDGTCALPEDATNCFKDCGCGNGICTDQETKVSCPKDCGCGNGKCEADETATSCPKDCYCGDGTCSTWEDKTSCPGDCALGCKPSPNGDPGCGGCECEACVCKGPIPNGNPTGDDWCCSNSWDSICAGECKQCSPGFCGP